MYNKPIRRYTTVKEQHKNRQEKNSITASIVAMTAPFAMMKYGHSGFNAYETIDKFLKIGKYAPQYQMPYRIYTSPNLGNMNLGLMSQGNTTAAGQSLKNVVRQEYNTLQALIKTYEEDLKKMADNEGLDFNTLIQNFRENLVTNYMKQSKGIQFRAMHPDLLDIKFVNIINDDGFSKFYCDQLRTNYHRSINNKTFSLSYEMMSGVSPADYTSNYVGNTKLPLVKKLAQEVKIRGDLTKSGGSSFTNYELIDTKSTMHNFARMPKVTIARGNSSIPSVQSRINVIEELFLAEAKHWSGQYNKSVKMDMRVRNTSNTGNVVSQNGFTFVEVEMQVEGSNIPVKFQINLTNSDNSFRYHGQTYRGSLVKSFNNTDIQLIHSDNVIINNNANIVHNALGMANDGKHSAEDISKYIHSVNKKTIQNLGLENRAYNTNSQIKVVDPRLMPFKRAKFGNYNRKTMVGNVVNLSESMTNGSPLTIFDTEFNSNTNKLYQMASITKDNNGHYSYINLFIEHTDAELAELEEHLRTNMHFTDDRIEEITKQIRNEGISIDQALEKMKTHMSISDNKIVTKSKADIVILEKIVGVQESLKKDLIHMIKNGHIDLDQVIAFAQTAGVMTQGKGMDHLSTEPLIKKAIETLEKTVKDPKMAKKLAHDALGDVAKEMELTIAVYRDLEKAFTFGTDPNKSFNEIIKDLSSGDPVRTIRTKNMLNMKEKKVLRKDFYRTFARSKDRKVQKFVTGKGVIEITDRYASRVKMLGVDVGSEGLAYTTSKTKLPMFIHENFQHSGIRLGIWDTANNTIQSSKDVLVHGDIAELHKQFMEEFAKTGNIEKANDVVNANLKSKKLVLDPKKGHILYATSSDHAHKIKKGQFIHDVRFEITADDYLEMYMSTAVEKEVGIAKLGAEKVSIHKVVHPSRMHQIGLDKGDIITGMGAAFKASKGESGIAYLEIISSLQEKLRMMRNKLKKLWFDSPRKEVIDSILQGITKDLDLSTVGPQAKEIEKIISEIDTITAMLNKSTDMDANVISQVALDNKDISKKLASLSSGDRLSILQEAKIDPDLFKITNKDIDIFKSYGIAESDIVKFDGMNPFTRSINPLDNKETMILKFKQRFEEKIEPISSKYVAVRNDITGIAKKGTKISTDLFEAMRYRTAPQFVKDLLDASLHDPRIINRAFNVHTAGLSYIKNIDIPNSQLLNLPGFFNNISNTFNGVDISKLSYEEVSNLITTSGIRNAAATLENSGMHKKIDITDIFPEGISVKVDDILKEAFDSLPDEHKANKVRKFLGLEGTEEINFRSLLLPSIDELDPAIAMTGTSSNKTLNQLLRVSAKLTSGATLDEKQDATRRYILSSMRKIYNTTQEDNPITEYYAPKFSGIRAKIAGHHDETIKKYSLQQIMYGKEEDRNKQLKFYGLSSDDIKGKNLDQVSELLDKTELFDNDRAIMFTKDIRDVLDATYGITDPNQIRTIQKEFETTGQYTVAASITRHPVSQTRQMNLTFINSEPFGEMAKDTNRMYVSKNFVKHIVGDFDGDQAEVLMRIGGLLPDKNRLEQLRESFNSIKMFSNGSFQNLKGNVTLEQLNRFRSVGVNINSDFNPGDIYEKIKKGILGSTIDVLDAYNIQGYEHIRDIANKGGDIDSSIFDDLIKIRSIQEAQVSSNIDVAGIMGTHQQKMQHVMSEALKAGYVSQEEFDKGHDIVFAMRHHLSLAGKKQVGGSPLDNDLPILSAVEKMSEISKKFSNKQVDFTDFYQELSSVTDFSDKMGVDFSDTQVKDIFEKTRKFNLDTKNKYFKVPTSVGIRKGNIESLENALTELPLGDDQLGILSTLMTKKSLSQTDNFFVNKFNTIGADSMGSREVLKSVASKLNMSKETSKKLAVVGLGVALIDVLSPNSNSKGIFNVGYMPGIDTEKFDRTFTPSELPRDVSITGKEEFDYNAYIFKDSLNAQQRDLVRQMYLFGQTNKSIIPGVNQTKKIKPKVLHRVEYRI